MQWFSIRNLISSSLLLSDALWAVSNHCTATSEFLSNCVWNRRTIAKARAVILLLRLLICRLYARDKVQECRYKDFAESLQQRMKYLPYNGSSIPSFFYLVWSVPHSLQFTRSNLRLLPCCKGSSKLCSCTPLSSTPMAYATLSAAHTWAQIALPLERSYLRHWSVIRVAIGRGVEGM